MGADITSTNSQGFDISTSTAEGSRAFKKAIDQLTNAEAWDINLLVVPGVNYQQHPYICSYAITVCEDRQDTFYIMDLTSYSANVATATSTANTIDSSYAGAYFPWVRVINTDTNKFLWAPPSVVLPEVFAYSDSVSAEWFAPAGLNRGGIPGASGVSSRLNRTNRDELYENKVNPIAQFPGQGIVAFGQKTLQTRPSALDRINVRRMVLTVKKFIASSSRYLLFEQNTEATRQRFLNIVNPYLASVQERQGLYAFRVVMDETNNTPDVIDRNQLVGQIYLQPTRTAEFIILDFNILPTGATFGS
jgi:phage tail sheath protein FI